MFLEVGLQRIDLLQERRQSFVASIPLPFFFGQIPCGRQPSAETQGLHTRVNALAGPAQLWQCAAPESEWEEGRLSGMKPSQRCRCGQCQPRGW